MKILIVEDDPNKIFKIESYLKSQIENINLDFANSFNSGIRKILKGEYDLILLDMTMPNFDKNSSSSGGKPVQFAGKVILSDMKRKRIKTPVIVITQYANFGESDNLKSFDELHEDLAKEYSTNLIDMIYYDTGKSDWENQLKSILEENFND
ncbi:response regulator [Bacillus sp. FJAT-29790]|uniref:response regulator n=1 Tax=Bacillus sp. FJAT-29790 TaxID=1895002 RepID=UPI001C21EBAD|nr:response regulator [Bacillus sp. FJAT-29790]MBU8879232.1 response regulator [Bacillus sp. FJAT-29790]